MGHHLRCGVISDYNFRSITQSNHKPSVAAYFEPRYNINANLRAYVGVGAEGISFPNRAAGEVDFYGGIRPTFGKIALDFGFWESYYPGGERFDGADPACNPSIPVNGNIIKADLGFYELYGKTTYTVNDQFAVGGRLYWSPSVVNSGADGTYIAANAKYTLPNLSRDVGWYAFVDLGHWSSAPRRVLRQRPLQKLHQLGSRRRLHLEGSSPSTCATSAPTSARATATPSPATRPPRA